MTIWIRRTLRWAPGWLPVVTYVVVSTFVAAIIPVAPYAIPSGVGVAAAVGSIKVGVVLRRMITAPQSHLPPPPTPQPSAPPQQPRRAKPPAAKAERIHTTASGVVLGCAGTATEGMDILIRPQQMQRIARDIAGHELGRVSQSPPPAEFRLRIPPQGDAYRAMTLGVLVGDVVAGSTHIHVATLGPPSSAPTWIGIVRAESLVPGEYVLWTSGDEVPDDRAYAMTIGVARPAK